MRISEGEILAGDSSERKYQVGVIGGKYGLNELFPVLSSMQNLRTVFINSGNSSLNEKSIRTESHQKTTHLEEALENKSIKLIFMAIPPSAQLSLGSLILKHKKDLYCEKPVGINYKETQSLKKISYKHKARVYVGFQFRFDPGINVLQKLVELNQIGNISCIEVNWHTTGESANRDKLNWRNNVELGGGVHRDFLCHVVDYIRWICSSDTSVLHALQQLVIDPKARFDLYNLNAISNNKSSLDLKINLSRGNVSTSRWEIFVRSDIGEIRLNTHHPFSIGDYDFSYTGTKIFAQNIKNHSRTIRYSPSQLSTKAARTFALESFFNRIINNVFENGTHILPGLEDALVTQRVSDNFQKFL
jgi:predicted dehydrogenase